jgi:hypothetical protein
MADKDTQAIAEELQRTAIDQTARAQQTRKLLDAWEARNQAAQQLLATELDWLRQTRAQVAITDEIACQAKRTLDGILLQMGGGAQCSYSPGR